MSNAGGYPPQQQQQHQVTPPGSVVSAAGAAEDDYQQQQQQQQPNEPENNDVLIPSIPDEETQDGIIRNVDAIAKIRDTWIYKQVRLRQDEFTNYQPALLYVGTWNVNAKGKMEDELSDWIRADWNNVTGPPDIVAVGFQEIVDLNAANVVVDNKTQQKSQFWCERLHQTLNSNSSSGGGGGGYTLLAQKSMVGLLVCVFVKTVHRPRVQYLSATSVGVGVMGMMGNKGGVSVRLQFYDSTLCFVCSHLAAHRENVTGRNADFQNVYSKTSFEIGEEAIREVIRSGSLSHWAIGSSSVGIPDHDLVFWLGDLNYRIDESMPTETVLRLAEKGAIHQLEPLDQLNIERAAGRVLRNFQEGRLTFPPTYKYQPGTHTYDQRPEKKVRAPAWCDRILWTAQEPKHVQQLTYSRSEMPNISDHKPVYSTLRVTIKDVVQQKREAIYDELMRKLDRYENKALPIVGLDRASLDFGEIRYGQRVSLPIQIANRGIVVAQFRLVPKLDEVRAYMCALFLSCAL
jgi:inositol polyphosphate 5-phosphatase INPP5B/F